MKRSKAIKLIEKNWGEFSLSPVDGDTILDLLEKAGMLREWEDENEEKKKHSLHQ